MPSTVFEWNEFPETSPLPGVQVLVLTRSSMDEVIPWLRVDELHAPTDEYPQGWWDSSDWYSVTYWADYPTLPTRDPETQSVDVREYLGWPIA